MRKSTVLILLCGLLPAAVRAEPENELAVQEALGRLGHTEFKTRVAAQSELSDWGKKHLQEGIDLFFEHYRTSDDPECPLGAVTLKGRAEFIDDRETKDWFYHALAKKQSPADKAGEDDFYSLLDSPLRLVLAITPEKWISFDADKSARHRAGTLAEEEMSPMESADAERLGRERAKRGIEE